MASPGKSHGPRLALQGGANTGLVQTTLALKDQAAAMGFITGAEVGEVVQGLSTEAVAHVLTQKQQHKTSEVRA
jgi:hypothetical protein